MENYMQRNSHLEVVDDALAVKEVVRDRKEVPVECLAPGILLLFLWMAVLSGRFQGEQSCDFAVHEGLAKHDQNDHVGMPKQQES